MQNNLPLIKDIPLFLDDVPAVYALRQKAKKALQNQEYPTKKTEAWKYTDITPILKKDFSIDTSEQTCDTCCCDNHNDDQSFININFCNGKLHIKEFHTPSGVTITPLPILLYEGEHKNRIFSSFDLEKHPFAALNGIYLEQGICIHLEKDTKLSSPIFINYNQTNCTGNMICLHNLVIMEKNTQADIVEKFSSEKNNIYFCNTVNEIFLKDNAVLHHYKKQQESSNAYHIALNAAKINENASYQQYYFAEGAKICRHETIVDLSQPQAKTEIYSAYTAKKGCLNDITTNINHLCSETVSNQYAKAVLESNSTAVFQGKIHIAPLAIRTNGNQLHKALYLDDNAKLNCKPELEIFADDVKCSHGASCGEIDKEQLFYLMSRGIDKNNAIQILTDAHLKEIINLIPNEQILNSLFA